MLVIAAFLKLGFQCGFLQIIFAPKSTESLSEGSQEGKSALSQEVCNSTWGGQENEWTWDGDSQEFFEEETGLYHRTCSFKKERYING